MNNEDFVSIIERLTQFIQNERTTAYNEGVDAEREACAKIADKWVMSWGGENPGEQRGAEVIAEEIRKRNKL